MVQAMIPRYCYNHDSWATGTGLLTPRVMHGLRVLCSDAPNKTVNVFGIPNNAK